jgi:UDP-N-acetylmuramoyl-tripeptide--D-alanyl-D-alanine ligase
MIELTLSQAATALHAQFSGLDASFAGISTDTRQLKPGMLYVALRGQRFDGHQFLAQAQQQGAIAAVVEQAVTLPNFPMLQVENTLNALGELAKLWRQRFTIPLIALTGSNGKTTTKEMIHAIFSQQGHGLATQGNLNNEIGVPLTLFRLGQEHRYAVIEMGANHAGEISYLTQIAQPTVALITQCAPSHLEGFKSLDGVAHAKGEIFSGLRANGVAVINVDDNYKNLWQQLATPHQILSFGFNHAANVTATNIHLTALGSEFTLQTEKGEIAVQLPLLGKHNIMNALAASAAALACDIPLTIIRAGLQTIQSVKGRLQPKTARNGNLLLDDTYNANPTSLRAALEVLMHYPAPRWLVLGDMNELGQESAALHQQSGKLARELGVEQLWAVGTMSKHAADSFGAPATHFDDHLSLIAALQSELAQQQGITLLIKGSRGMTMEQVVQALQ